MKIALVSEHASPIATLGGVDAGGQNVHVAALARALGAAGHAVTVYTRRDDRRLPETVRFARGVRVVHVDAGPARRVPKDDLFACMPEFASHLYEQWHRDPPDIVHSHFWMSGWASLQAASRVGAPVVHTYHALGVTKQRHQGPKDTSPRERLRIERAIAQRATGILATSTEEVFELTRMGAEPSRLTLIPCGVDLDLFHPRRAPRRTDGSLRILVVSRLVERKGIGNMILAMASLPDARLVIAGGPPRSGIQDDPEGARLVALAREHGVADRVEFLGRVERADLPALYAAADVVACVPWYEPFGLVALEAMACGRPIVASAVGGLVDTVIHGSTGLHVTPRSPESIVRAMTFLAEQPRYRDALGEAGARRARARYGWATIARESTLAYASARAANPRVEVSAG